MDHYQAALKLWKESKRTGDRWVRLEHFEHMLEMLRRVPEGTDMTATAETVLRVRSWIHTLTVEEALERVVTASLHGIDPIVLEETLRFVVQSQGGFVRTDLSSLVFRYTFAQIRNARVVWELLPPQDRSVVTVDLILEAGLENHVSVVQQVVHELGSLQGPGLIIASMLKDCVAPGVAQDLWKSLRGHGPIVQDDYNLLQRCLEIIGFHPEIAQQSVANMMDEANLGTYFSRGQPPAVNH